MPEGNEFQRRLPAVEREIGSIQPADIRVRVIARIIDKQGDRLVLDDGTGKIEVTLDQPVEQEPNSLVRVFGRVIPQEGGFELHGEIVQALDGFDMELWKKIRGLEGKS